MIGGKTTIAPDVLVSIARLTTLNVDGVSRMAEEPSSVNRLLKRGVGGGVQLEIRDDFVFASLSVILKNDVNIREVSHRIQQHVSRAISEMVGMQVGRVNVHIHDIDYAEVQEVRSSHETTYQGA
jgi:uncharacterized alkaline shock family protein YloU